MSIIDNIPTKKVYTEINLMVDDLDTYDTNANIGSLYSETKPELDIVTIQKDENKPHYVSLSSNNNKDTDTETSNEDKEEIQPLIVNKGLSTQLYIGSLSIIGLFVFYRVLYKFK